MSTRPSTTAASTPAASTEFEVLHPDPIHRVEQAMEDLRQGRMVILVDDDDRENEGDLVCAADRVTPETINFMATHGRGLICLSMTSEQVQRLGLHMMASHNQSPYNTAFTVSIEAREGVTTGISAADRAHTIQVAVHPDVTPREIVTPGHMFPLRARDGGVLERVGQTEGSVDLARLAGLAPAGVICEVMKPDGSMARLPDLKQFGRDHHIRIVAVADIIKYRMRNERIVRCEGRGHIDIPGRGTWETRLYRSEVSGDLHMALIKGRMTTDATLVRVQPAPPSWAFLNDSVSQAGAQAAEAQRLIDDAGGGALVLMHVRGGSDEHLLARFLKDFEGEEARPTQLKAEVLRDLGTGCQILLDLGLRDVRIITRSSRALVGIEAYGLRVVEMVPLHSSKE